MEFILIISLGLMKELYMSINTGEIRIGNMISKFVHIFYGCKCHFYHFLLEVLVVLEVLGLLRLLEVLGLLEVLRLLEVLGLLRLLEVLGLL